MIGQAITMGHLAQILSQILGTTIVDKTGLPGTYDITLQWTPDANPPSTIGAAGAGPNTPDAAAPADTSGATIFTALEEQLGLKLESQKGPVDVIVIDHVEEPSEN
jgi:bla regulator protein blaR1